MKMIEKIASSHVGDTIKLFRQKKGYTQIELAERIGKSLSTVQRYEKTGNISKESLDILIEVLNIPKFFLASQIMNLDELDEQSMDIETKSRNFNMSIEEVEKEEKEKCINDLIKKLGYDMYTLSKELKNSHFKLFIKNDTDKYAVNSDEYSHIIDKILRLVEEYYKIEMEKYRVSELPEKPSV